MAKRLSILAILIALLPLRAMAFPDKPVTYVIPFGAGGESGIAARLQQPVFKRLSGQELVIKYRPGGGGAVVWNGINTMPANGHTIVGINLPHILLQPLRGARYHTDDLAIAHIFHYTPHAIIVRDESGIETLADLIELMGEKPGRVTFSGSGRGTANHLGQLWFDTRLKARSTYIAYKGTAASITALLREKVDAAWGYTTVGAKYGGEVRMLAVAMEKRHPNFPDVPTFKELGYDFLGGAYRGVAVPKSTSVEIQELVSDLFGRISADPELRRQKEALGFAPLDIRRDEIAAFLAARNAEYLPVARAAGLIK
jgi:tripartite-type tricarboxylate transporter receptor subunit TctC